MKQEIPLAESSENVINVEKLTKDFGSLRALDNFDLLVKVGEVHGFLGPNGAGKSTTIRILLGLLRKTSGKVTILGGDPWRDAVEIHRRLAYIPGEVNLWPNLTGGEIIDLLSKLRGGLDHKRRDDLLKRFELDPTKKFRTYSKGNRQKVAIVAALASDVDLYIFDEPSSGLDPLMEALFQDSVKDLKSAGKTVLLSSHILSEAEALCDRITIIRKGKAVQSGTLAELKRLTRLSVSVDTKKPIVELGRMPGVYNLTVSNNHAEFEIEPQELDGVLQHLTPLGIANLISAPPTLEKLFVQYYGDKLEAAIEKEVDVY